MTQHPLVKFADVIHLNTDRVSNPTSSGIDRFVGLEHIEPENLHIRRWGLVADGTTFTNTFKRGQVLFGKRRAYQRKVAVADFDGVCSSDIYVFESKDPNVLLPELVPFICQLEGFFDYAVKTSAGSLSPRTNWSHLANYEFPLPPVDEQRRIADLLWAADDAITEYQNTAAAAKNLLVRSCIDWTNNTDWKIFRLQDCSENLDNLRVPLNQETRATKQGDIPYYGANGIIDYIDDFIFDEEVVLLGEDGDHFYKWQDWKQSQLTSGKSWVNNHAHVFKAKTDICSNRWLYRHFQHRNLTGLIQDSASMTRRKLTKAMLLNIRVPIPTLEEQEEIVGKIDEIEKTYEQLLEHLEICKKLKKEILNKHLG